MKYRGWLETAEARVITTAGEAMVVHKGDHVIVAVIERWDDIDVAIKALQRLAGRGEDA